MTNPEVIQLKGRKELLEAFQKVINEELGTKSVGNIYTEKYNMLFWYPSDYENYTENSGPSFWSLHLGTRGFFDEYFLPKDWDVALERILSFKKKEIKIGDWVKNTHFQATNSFLKIKEIASDSYDGRFEDKGHEFATGIAKGSAVKIDNNELETLLIAEAKKRGFEGIVRARLRDKDGSLQDSQCYEIRFLTLDLSTGVKRLYFNHKIGWVWDEEHGWAETVKDPFITINGYIAQVKEGKIHFGCQSFSREDITVLRYFLLRSEIHPSIRVEDTEITLEILDKLIKMLEN